MARVLIIGDPHCPGMHKKVPAWLSQIYKKHKCNRVVCIGDLVDWSSISYHEKDPSAPGPAAERKEAQKQVNMLYKRFTVADWMIGNHDALPRRKAESAGLLDDMLISDVDYWGLDGWTAHNRFEFLNIDDVLYSHGEHCSGQYAHVNLSRKMAQSCVIGHHHSLHGVQTTANMRDAFFGMAVGTSIDWKISRFKYGKKFTSKPIVGCGVVIDGEHAIAERMCL